MREHAGGQPLGVQPLSELDDVDWASLDHPCNGPSMPRIPGMVRALAEGGADEEHALWCYALHQGIVGEATGYLLPFIFGLMLDQPRLRPILVDWPTQTSRAFEDDNPHGETTRQAWRAAASALLPLVEDSDGEFRSAMAGALSEIDVIDHTVWEAIHHQVQRKPTKA